MSSIPIRKPALANNSASQLDNPACPTDQPVLSQGLSQGRQGIFSLTPAPAQEQSIKADYQYITSTLEPYSFAEKLPFCSIRQLGFLKSMPEVFSFLIPDLTVVFHNNDLITGIFERYTPKKADLFLQWVKIFAMMQREYREPLIRGVIQTTDQDFSLALRLFKVHHLAPNPITDKDHKTQVWHIIQKYFLKTPFSLGDIQSHLFIRHSSIGGALRYFRDELKTIRYIPRRDYHQYNSGHRKYVKLMEVVTKPEAQ